MIVVGCDVIVYLGGVLVECIYDLIEVGNIRGVYNFYEVVCINGNLCIFFVSLNYMIGYYC